MTGCRHNAKNTLVKNYLHLAEQAGAVVHPLTTVTRRTARATEAGTTSTARWTKAKLSRRTAVRTFTADHVVFSAAALGTQKLLHRLKAEGHLPRISDRLGVLTRTNSEAILGASASDTVRRLHARASRSPRRFHPDEHTHVEPVRYGRGSNVMSLLPDRRSPTRCSARTAVAHLAGRATGAQRRQPRTSTTCGTGPSAHVIALVMQSLDNSITTCRRRRRRFGWRCRSQQGHGAPNPTYIPSAYDAVRRTATHHGRPRPSGAIGEPFNVPMTAHFIGGCTIGDSPADGRRRPLPAALRLRRDCTSSTGRRSRPTSG